MASTKTQRPETLMDDLFSIENLRKMAGPSPSPTNSSPSPNPRPIDDLFSVENLTKLSGKTKMDGGEQVEKQALANVDPKKSDTSAKIDIPIELNLGGLSENLRAEARIMLKLSIDLSGMCEIQSITDRNERIRKLREIIKLDDSTCEINLTT